MKSFQAGRRGICPYCAAKFLIPTESTRNSSKQERAAFRAIATDSSPIINPLSQNIANPATPSASIPPPNIDSSITAAKTFPLADAAGSTTERPNDPFIEAGNVVWYVRSPAGGQYGPAAATVMRQWLSEGRISHDSLVWREGWRDWRQASAVFPQLYDSLAESAKADVSYSPPGSSSTSGMFSLSKINNMPLFISLLIIAVIVLICVLLMAVNRGSTSTPDKSNTPSTRLELRDTLSPSRFL